MKKRYKLAVWKGEMRKGKREESEIEEKSIESDIRPFLLDTRVSKTLSYSYYLIRQGKTFFIIKLVWEDNKNSTIYNWNKKRIFLTF